MRPLQKMSTGTRDTRRAKVLAPFVPASPAQPGLNSRSDLHPESRAQYNPPAFSPVHSCRPEFSQSHPAEHFFALQVPRKGPDFHRGPMPGDHSGPPRTADLGGGHFGGKHFGGGHFRSALLLTTLLLTACELPGPTPGTDDPTPTPNASTPTPVPFGRYHATIRRTEYGIPHIWATDIGSAGFGQGYAFAQGHSCILADQIVKVRSERALYFGPGTEGEHADSDFGYLHLKVYQNAIDNYDKQPTEVKDLIEGFAAGYNQYLADVGPEGLPDECRNVAWVKPISAIDLLAYYTGMAMMSSSQALIPGMARAAPPGTTYGKLPSLPNLRDIQIGSNGIALGKERTDNGRGMLLSNPHFAWEGELKLFESHLTVPGQLNVYGVSLMGVAGINIGFNDQIAWTHTVSHAARGSFYQLTLDVNDPTAYEYDGKTRHLTSDTYTIQVLQYDGSLKPESRILWSSHIGPMLATEELGWTRKNAITFRDANEDNDRLLEQFYRMSISQSMDELITAHAEVNAIPWANTIATDMEGNAWYSDSSSVPNLSAETIEAWQQSLTTTPLSVVAWDLGAPLLDGSTSRDEWVADPHPRKEGLIPFSSAPSLLRTDYVANGNDNQWLTHLVERLEGFSPMYLPERSPRTPRTRMNLWLLEEEGDGSASGADHRFSLEELGAMVMDNRGIIADLLLPELLQRCSGVTTVRYENQSVDVEKTCKALARFDGHMNLDSQGAAAWREFLGAFEFEDLMDAGPLFSSPFNANDPLFTPYGLALKPERGTDTILEALAAATLALNAAGIDPSSSLRLIQTTNKAGEILPIHGSNGREGGVNQVSFSGGVVLNSSLLPRTDPGTIYNSNTTLTANGYPINYGTSFVMTLQYTDSGPKAKALLTYSESSDARSPYFADQTRLFSQRQWRSIRFSEEDILAAPSLETYEVGSRD